MLTVQSYSMDADSESVQGIKTMNRQEIEVVKKTCCLVIDEKRTIVHEEEIDNHDSCEEVLKRYCEEHDGKFFAIAECRYEVKE